MKIMKIILFVIVIHNNAVYMNNNNKSNLSRAELREKYNEPKINSSDNNINNSKNNIYLSKNSYNSDSSNKELNKKPYLNPIKILSLKNNEIKKHNDTDSLKSISINKDNLEKNIINDSPINNSLLNKNSINSINNNIKKYINKPKSSLDSFINSLSMRKII